MGYHGRRIDDEWLREHYPRATDIHELLDDHEKEFGWRPSKTAAYVKANKMGLHKDPVRGRGDRAERRVVWSKEPALEQWMLEHDHGQRTDALRDAFEQEFGFRLSRSQINIFRASHGTQKRGSHGGRPRKPVGFERVTKDGFIIVKFAEEATVPMSADNWKLKHVLVWEQANGPLPDGMHVFFADRNKRNFDPSNLVAVPKWMSAMLNNPASPEWHDKETLLAAMAWCELKSKVIDIEAETPRTCGVCGRSFVPTPGQRGRRTPIITCPECLAAGHKAVGMRVYKKKAEQ